MNAQIQVDTQAMANPPGKRSCLIEQSVFGVGAHELVCAQADSEEQQQPPSGLADRRLADDQPNGRKGKLPRHPQQDKMPPS
jgi:hypothetical protein